MTMRAAEANLFLLAPLLPLLLRGLAIRLVQRTPAGHSVALRLAHVMRRPMPVAARPKVALDAEGRPRTRPPGEVQIRGAIVR
jgi:hypothetical protein